MPAIQALVFPLSSLMVIGLSSRILSKAAGQSSYKQYYSVSNSRNQLVANELRKVKITHILQIKRNSVSSNSVSLNYWLARTQVRATKKVLYGPTLNFSLTSNSVSLNFCLPRTFYKPPSYIHKPYKTLISLNYKTASKVTSQDAE